MPLLKRNSRACVVLIALAALAASSQAARAETIVLTCQGGNNPPSLIKINTDNNTVVDGQAGRSGSFLARITDEEISWDENPQMYFQYTLNRMTGNLHYVGTGTIAGATGNEQCHKTEKQF